MEIYFGNEKLEIYFQFEISISRASANLHRSAFVSRKNLTRNICILCSSQRSTKTKRENPSLFFFFFFNAIKAADRHRGLAQRGISQSQLIASSFSFFFFFFLFNRFAASKRIYSPLTIVNRGTMKFDEFTGRCSYRDAQILSLKHSLPRLNWSWIVTSRFDLLSPHHGIHRFVQIIKRYPMRH